MEAPSHMIDLQGGGAPLSLIYPFICIFYSTDVIIIVYEYNKIAGLMALA